MMNDANELSVFRRQKLFTYFSRFDYDGNSSIEREDMDQILSPLLDDATSEQKVRLKKAVDDIWEKCWKTVDVDGDNSISFEEFYSNFIQLNESELRQSYSTLIRLIFDTIDNDDSGSITVREFRLWFKCFRLPEKDAN
ncbi:hypothetical protein SNEBB_001566, partial [Seison nebaliae]